jgi:hypothetical protein
MNIFKLSSAICVLAFCANFIPARAQDNPAQAAARAALDQQFQSMTPAQPAASVPRQPRILTDPQPATTVQQPAGLAHPEDSSVAAAKAKSESQKETALAEQKHAEAEKAASMASNANPAINQRGLKPIVAPPLPISAAKQAQLDTLLNLYKADRISPADYQKQRAAVLAGPN